MRHAVANEDRDNDPTYVPNPPGCIATGATIAETEREISDAIRLHIEGLREDALPDPAPVSSAKYVEARTRNPPCPQGEGRRAKRTDSEAG